MKINFKTLVISFCVGLFFLGFSESSSAQLVGVDIDLQFKGKMLSANLNGVTLKAVFEKLREEKGIWFRGNESLFEEKVSIQFAGLSLQDGLKRILSRIDYSLVFDKNKRLIGAILIGKGTAGLALAEGKAIASKKNILSPSIEKNNSIPDGLVNVTSEGLENFKVIKNCLPPGGPVNVTAKELENFKVIRDSPPPGGPVKVTAEELENFKVIKNCPPGP